jgi:hypothetical protein
VLLCNIFWLACNIAPDGLLEPDPIIVWVPAILPAHTPAILLTTQTILRRAGPATHCLVACNIAGTLPCNIAGSLLQYCARDHNPGIVWVPAILPAHTLAILLTTQTILRRVGPPLHCLTAYNIAGAIPCNIAWRPQQYCTLGGSVHCFKPVAVRCQWALAPAFGWHEAGVVRN